VEDIGSLPHPLVKVCEVLAHDRRSKAAPAATRVMSQGMSNKGGPPVPGSRPLLIVPGKMSSFLSLFWPSPAPVVVPEGAASSRAHPGEPSPIPLPLSVSWQSWLCGSLHNPRSVLLACCWACLKRTSYLSFGGDDVELGVPLPEQGLVEQLPAYVDVG
jgi:hypothetical protein